MEKQSNDQTVASAEKTTDQARQGVTGHNVRYVLWLSTIGAGIGLIVILYLFAT